MKLYDFTKAEAFIKDRIESIETAELGMKQDWNWTSETIFEDGAFAYNLSELKTIAGIDGSTWATPTLSVTYKDGTEDEMPCYYSDGEDTPEAQINFQKQFALMTGGRAK